MKRRSILACLALAVLLGTTALADGRGAARTRSSGSSGGGDTRASGSASSGRSTSAARESPGPIRTATGRATYRHYRVPRVHRYPYYVHGGYYSGYPWLYYGWGVWPWGYYYYPYDHPYYRLYAGGGGYAESVRHAPAVIETVVRPKRASVWLDGREVGQARDYSGTWDELYVQPGEHTVELRADGYQTYRVAMRLQPASRHVIEIRLRRGEGLDPRSVTAASPLPASAPAEARKPEAPQPDTPGPAELDTSIETPADRGGLLRLRVEPPDAAVYLDGEFLGTGRELSRMRGALPVAEGTHRIEVARPGYATERLRVQIAEGKPVTVDVRLEPGD